MVKIVLTPEWFVGADVIIEFFSLIVLLLIVILAVKNYKKNPKNKNLLYLALGFSLITLANLASIFTKLVLYYDIGPSRRIGQIIITSNIVGNVDIFYHIGFFFFKFLTLLGLYTIYRLPRDKKSVIDYVIVIYFIVISSLIQTDLYYIFHLTAFIMMVAITEKYYLVYKENKFTNTKILMSAFLGLSLSRLIFVLSKIDIIFAIANIIELISYTILLSLVIRILQNGKEEKPYGDNIGYAGYHPRKKQRN
ncbi:MAG: hypothetical protein QXX55_00375 [Candidatus Pacearchaeota archaeon]